MLACLCERFISFQAIRSSLIIFLKKAKAISLFERAIAIETEVHGENHPRVAFDEECLGKALLLNNNIEEALHAHLVALEVSRSCNGEKHPHTYVFAP